MEQTLRTNKKLFDDTVAIATGIQKLIGRLDPDTLESVTYIIYNALADTADDVMKQAISDGYKPTGNTHAK